MDIEGLDKITNVVAKAGLVTNPADLYALDIATVAGTDRMGEVSATKLVASIHASKIQRLSRY
jgi:DNA ligase (NAD+)